MNKEEQEMLMQIKENEKFSEPIDWSEIKIVSFFALVAFLLFMGVMKLLGFY